MQFGGPKHHKGTILGPHSVGAQPMFFPIFKTLLRCIVMCFPISFAPKSQLLVSKIFWTTHNTKDGATQ